jgi:hypothetical protein
MSIYKNRIASTMYVESLGTITLTGSAVTLKTLNTVTFGQIRSFTIVLNGGTITGAAVLTIYGSTATSGGTLTAIAAITIAISATTGVLQIDAEDIVEAAEVAGLLPGNFLSIQAKITGTNTDTIKGTLIVEPLHERVGLTPSSVTALT